MPGNYEKMRRTYKDLKAAAHPNVTVGIHAVVSQFNVEQIPALREHVRREFVPDSFITEIAEERLELDTIGEDITPTAEQYAAGRRRSRGRHRLRRRQSDSPALVQAFRREYYQIAHRTLVGAAAGAALLCGSRVGADRAQRRRVDLLHPRRIDGQPA